jgi:uncharacterized protein
MGPIRFQSSLNATNSPASDSARRAASAATPGEMFGYLTLANPAQASGQGVLLCNPLGQEAVRSHRMYRVLSERLARAGVACLRFDYLGTGDSDGDDEDVSLQTCIANTLQADQELRRLANCTHVSWVGLRFGASVAAHSSMSAVQKPDRLFLWDPIDDGAKWIQQLKGEHQTALHALTLSRPATLPALAMAQPLHRAIAPAFESQGFLLSTRLHDEIMAIQVKEYASLRCSRLIVLAAGEAQRQQFASLEQARHIHSYEMHQVEAAQWNNDEAISSAIVANDVISLVVQEMAGGGQ